MKSLCSPHGNPYFIVSNLINFSNFVVVVYFNQSIIAIQYNIILYNIQNRKTEKVSGEAKKCSYIPILNYYNQINQKMNMK